MNSLKLSVALCAFAVCIVVVHSGEGKGKWKKNMKCDGQDFKKQDEETEKKIMEAEKACFEKFAGTEGDKKEKWAKAMGNACFTVCKLQAKGMLDDKGAFNKAKSEENANNLYPTKELADGAIAGINACATEIGLEDGKALSMDEDCKAYKPLHQCMSKSFMEVCKISMDWGRKHKCDGQDFKKPEGDDAAKAMKEIREAKKACWTKYAGTEGDIKEKWQKIKENACFGVCELQAKGVLDDKGNFNKAKAEEDAKNLYPTTELADAVIAGINSCANEIGLEDGKALSMDDDCKAYKDFPSCMMKKHMEVCKSKKTPAKAE